jgi:hypothetical protein
VTGRCGCAKNLLGKGETSVWGGRLWAMLGRWPEQNIGDNNVTLVQARGVRATLGSPVNLSVTQMIGATQTVTLWQPLRCARGSLAGSVASSNGRS